MFRASLLIAAAAVALAGCDDEESGNTGDTGHAVDIALTADGAIAGDSGATVDTVATADSVQAPDIGAGDVGDLPDTGPKTTCTPGAGSTVCKDSWASPCGGDPIGSWTLASACASKDLGVLGICYPGTITDNSTVSGSLVFDGTTLTRNVTFNVSLEVHVPPACTGNGTASCSSLAAGMTQNVAIGTVTCADDGSQGCDCQLIANISDVSTASYTLDGNEIVVDKGLATERRWAYCISSGVLTARESGTGVAEEDIVQVYSCAD